MYLDKSGPFFDTGERLYDFSGDKPRLILKDPGIRIGALEQLCNLISGENESGVVIEHLSLAAKVCTAAFSNVQQLERRLLENRQVFPLIARVHSGNTLFGHCPGTWHTINIMDYNAETKRVSISNQWGKNSDRQIKLDQLFNSSIEIKAQSACQR